MVTRSRREARMVCGRIKRRPDSIWSKSQSLDAER